MSHVRVAAVADGCLSWTDPVLDAPMRHMTTAPAAAPGTLGTIPLHVTHIDAPLDVGDAPEACYSGNSRALIVDGWTVVTDGASAVRVPPSAEFLDVRLHPSSVGEGRAIHFGGMTLALAVSLALRIRERFHIHAGAVSLDGRPLLIAGDSCAGKTTSTLALATAGGAWGGDDIAFMLRDGDAVRVYPCRRDFHLRPRTLAMFPAAAALAVAIPDDPGQRHCVAADALLGASGWEPGCTTGALLFPEITANAETRLGRLDEAEALGRLLTASGLVMVRSLPGYEAHEAALVRLVASAPSFAMLLGADAAARPATIPERVREALAGAGR